MFFFLLLHSEFNWEPDAFCATWALSLRITYLSILDVGKNGKKKFVVPSATEFLHIFLETSWPFTFTSIRKNWDS